MSAPQPGTYVLGPADGTLSVRTGRTGAAAKAGHNLLFHVTSWEARLTLAEAPAETALEVDVDATSLRVIEGTGGMQALGEDDKANIQETIDEEVLKRQAIVFRSTEVRPSADGGLTVLGDLTLLGRSAPLAVTVALDGGGTVRGTAIVKQTDWGMKPYSALFGALKVVDEVEVAIDVHLPAPQSL
jgi:polyisoprenoid-binding protein YceI